MIEMNEEEFAELVKNVPAVLAPYGAGNVGHCKALDAAARFLGYRNYAHRKACVGEMETGPSDVISVQMTVTASDTSESALPSSALAELDDETNQSIAVLSKEIYAGRAYIDPEMPGICCAFEFNGRLDKATRDCLAKDKYKGEQKISTVIAPVVQFANALKVLELDEGRDTKIAGDGYTVRINTDEFSIATPDLFAYVVPEFVSDDHLEMFKSLVEKAEKMAKSVDAKSHEIHLWTKIPFDILDAAMRDVFTWFDGFLVESFKEYGAEAFDSDMVEIMSKSVIA